MKRKVTLAITSILILATTSTSVFASEAEVPAEMQPGTVIVYDEDCKPTFLSGGYKKITRSQHTPSIDVEDYLANIPSDATDEEREKIEMENRAISDLFKRIEEGSIEFIEPCRVVPGMKVVYDEISGEINNVYYMDENAPSGYSLHGDGDFDYSAYAVRTAPPVWGVNYRNALIYQKADDSILGTGRATYFTDPYGNRDNKLKDYDCATEKTYDYSRKGDKPVAIRNLETDKSFTFYQADVGTLPDAVIDIWGLENLHRLAGKTTVTSVPSVRYYHKRFSDQAIPNWT